LIAAVKPDPDQPSPPSPAKEYGFRVRDAATIATLHRDAGFGYIELATTREIVTRPERNAMEARYSIVIARP